MTEQEDQDLREDATGVPSSAAERELWLSPEPGCICAETHNCAESDNQCPACIHLDLYDPCPAIGFGCGNGPYPPCDCCTLEQRKAATP